MTDKDHQEIMALVDEAVSRAFERNLAGALRLKTEVESRLSEVVAPPVPEPMPDKRDAFYDFIDRHIRNTLDDEAYAEMSTCLDYLYATPTEATTPQPAAKPAQLFIIDMEEGGQLAVSVPKPAQAEPVARDGWKLVPEQATLEMIAAYLTATDLYWKRTDELPTPPNKWRTGTPTGATAEGYRAMLAASPTQPRPQPLTEGGAP
jgi:hypothetical protein